MRFPSSFPKTLLLSAVLIGIVGSFVVVPKNVYGQSVTENTAGVIAGRRQRAADQKQALAEANQACNAVSGSSALKGSNFGGISSFLNTGAGIAGFALPQVQALQTFGKLFGLGGKGGSGLDQMTLDQICRAVKEQLLLQKRQEQAATKEKWSKRIAAVAYKNALTYFFTKLAYNAALKITSGGPGQKPLFVTNWTGRNGVLNTAIDEATGEFFNTLLKDVWKSSICEPITPIAKIRIELLARKIATPGLTPPSCSFSKFYKSIVGQDISKIKSVGDLGRQLSGAVSQLTLKDINIIQDYFNPTSNDLGALLTILSGLEKYRGERLHITELRRKIEGEFKPVTTVITDVVKTPAEVVRSIFEKYSIEAGRYPYLAYTGDALADAIGVFTNTLASRLMEQALTRGLNPQVNNQQIGLLILGGQSPIQAAMRKFASIIEKPDLKTGSQLNILEQITYVGGGDQFIQGTSIPEQNFALIDTGFRTAIEQRMTVRKALALGYLDGSKPFGMIPGVLGSENATVGGQGGNPNVYSWRSVKLLAKYRIVPGLWDAAAEFIVNQNGHSYCRNGRCTLSELVEKYSDATSPFYHLIDQTWILTAPEVFVRRIGYGRLVSADVVKEGDQIIGLSTIDRMSGPVDEQTCIYTDPENPSRCLYYGYCTEDRPIYRMQGNRCDAWYNTCQTVQQANGGTFSYVLNSVHKDTCAEPGAQGCREYCTRYNNISNAWECVSPGIVYNRCGSSNTPGVSTGTGYDSKDKECGCSIQNARGVAEFCQIPEGGISCVTAGGLLCRIGTSDIAALDPVTKKPIYPYAENPSTIFLNSRASVRTCSASGCSEFLRFRHPDTNAPYTKDETLLVLDMVDNDPNAVVDSYSTIAQAELSRLPKGKQPIVEKTYIRADDALCSEADLGCELYTPTNGDPAVPGIIDPLNGSCPKECNGLRRYQLFPSFFDPAPKVTQFDFSTLTVPSDQFCSASSDGCEEFTNQITSKTEYYTRFRSCVRPGTSGVVARRYFTYEGFDTPGLGLKGWDLVAENTSPTSPPCTNVQPNGTCATGQAAVCGGETPADPTDDQDVNPDCRQFYVADPSGASNVVTYWRLQSKTSFVSSECTNYRRSIDQSIWWAEPSESAPYQCEKPKAGCRQFKGVHSANIRFVPLGSGKLVENFEGSGTVDPITGGIIGWTGGTLSSRALYIGGRSARITTTLESNSVTAPLNLKKGAVYEVSFWAIAQSASGGTVSASLAEPSGAGEVATFTFGSGTLSGSNWQYFKGTLSGRGYLETVPPANTVLTVSAGGTFFIDNIVLKETPDSIYVVKDSWRTPPQCLNPSQLGCQEYTDQFQNKLYLKNFSRLCLPEAVGCAPVIDTHNSHEVAAHSWNLTNAAKSDDITIPADSLTYRVDSPATRCSSTEKGCQLLGRGSYEQHQSLSFIATSIIVDPAQFDRSLCTAEKEFCDAYTAEESAGAFFFKDPGARVCEWKTGVVDARGVYIPGGWFIRGTNQACPPYQSTATNAAAVDGYCLGGTSISTDQNMRSANKCRSNSECTNAFFPGQAGTCASYPAVCPSDQNTCSEFQDPQHPVRGTKPCDPALAFGEPLGAPVPNYCDYYYYQRNTMETGGCSGQNPEDGCVGLNDTANDQKTVATTKQCLLNGSPVQRCGPQVIGSLACEVVACQLNTSNCGVACADDSDCTTAYPGTTCGYL